MRRSPCIFFVFTLTIIFFLVHAGPGPAFAAKKRAFDQIKYPELNPLKLPDIRKANTENGIKLRLIKNEKLPLVSMRILLEGGEAYEPLAKIGLATITAQLLRIGGTKELTGDQVDRYLDSNGISISFSVEADYFRVSLSCLKENLDKALSILAKMLQQPAFDREKLEEIKTQLGSAIARRNDTPNSIRSREFNKLIYGADSPFGMVLEYEHLENISKQDVVILYRTFFAPDNMLVGVVGPLEQDELRQMIEKHFGKWQKKSRIPPFPEVKKQSHDVKVYFAEKSNINQSYFSVGHLGIKENPEEKAKIMVFNSIFSSGFDSRLNRRIRVKMGLTYGARGGINAEYLYPGITGFTTYTKSESTLEAIKAVFDEINIIRRELVEEKELKKAKDYLLNSYVFNYSTPIRIMSRNLANEFYGVPEDIDEKLPGDIKKVTAKDILNVAQKYLHPDDIIVLVVGNQEKIAESGELSQLGKVKTIDISIKPPPLKEKIPPASPEMLEKGKEILTSLMKSTYKGYKQLKSLEITKDAFMTVSGRTIDIKSKTRILYPDKLYNEASIMGGMMKVESIINGKTGVTKRMGQQTPMSEEEIEKQRFGDLYDIFTSIEKGKYKFQYLKEEKINGKTFDVIYIFDSQKNWVKFFINRDTRLIELEEQLSRYPGQQGTARTIKSGFKTINGITFAFQSKTYVNDKVVMESTTKQIKVNPRVDSSVFLIEEKK